MNKKDEIALRYQFEVELLRLSALGNYKDAYVNNLWASTKTNFVEIVKETTQKEEPNGT